VTELTLLKVWTVDVTSGSITSIFQQMVNTDDPFPTAIQDTDNQIYSISWIDIKDNKEFNWVTTINQTDFQVISTVKAKFNYFQINIDYDEKTKQFLSLLASEKGTSLCAVDPQTFEQKLFGEVLLDYHGLAGSFAIDMKNRVMYAQLNRKFGDLPWEVVAMDLDTGKYLDTVWSGNVTNHPAMTPGFFGMVWE
jgi:hypothetical protein